MFAHPSPLQWQPEKHSHMEQVTILDMSELKKKISCGPRKVENHENAIQGGRLTLALEISTPFFSLRSGHPDFNFPVNCGF